MARNFRQKPDDGDQPDQYAAMFGFDKLKEALGQIKKNNE